MLITPEQVRAACALLRSEQDELARRPGFRRHSPPLGGGARVSSTVLDGVRQALEQAGAEFIQDGVRKRPAKRKAAEAEALHQELRAISIQGGERLAGHEMLTDSDMYDKNGLPAWWWSSRTTRF